MQAQALVQVQALVLVLVLVQALVQALGLVLAIRKLGSGMFSMLATHRSTRRYSRRLRRTRPPVLTTMTMMKPSSLLLCRRTAHPTTSTMTMTARRTHPSAPIKIKKRTGTPAARDPRCQRATVSVQMRVPLLRRTMAVRSLTTRQATKATSSRRRRVLPGKIPTFDLLSMYHPYL